MSATASALALGAMVGLGVAVPLGAIGVLLLQTGMTQGWRPAAAGGLGAALVDLTYAAAAVLAGTALSATVGGHRTEVGVLGAVVLGVVAATGMRGATRARTTPRLAAATPGRTLARFVGLTAINPLTVVYFTAVAAGFADQLAGGSAKAAFVLGIAAASATWQLGLAAVGTVLGARVTPGVRTALAAVGYGVVGVFAIALLLRSLG